MKTRHAASAIVIRGSLGRVTRGINQGSALLGLLGIALCLIVPRQLQGSPQVWLQRFQAPGKTNNVATAMAADTDGRVFVTGYSHNGVRTSDQWTTIAYSGGGTPLWTNFYAGPQGSNEYATAIAVDNAGNVIVTGYSASTNAPAYYSDYVTIKYSSEGVSLWTNRYAGSADGRDCANALAVDDFGNVLVTGYSASTIVYPYNLDFATIKYSSAGVPLWTNRYNGPQDDNDLAVALAVDHNGNVFATGDSIGIGSSTDYATVAYSSAGLPMWTNRFNGTGNREDRAKAIAVDNTGNVFVTGYSSSAPTFPYNRSYVTIKYSNDGVPLWTNRYDGSDHTDDANALAVDASGDVYITGASVGSHYDFSTIKYSNAGILQWTNRWNGNANSDDTPVAAAIDNWGNLFVTGRSFTTGAGYDYATVGYSREGIPLWTNSYNHWPVNQGDEAKAIVVDGNGNVFVTGTSVSGNSSAYATIKYAPTGILLTLQKMENQVVLTWANPAFGLQSAPAVVGTFTNVPGATSPYTNSIKGDQQYFRLIAN